MKNKLFLAFITSQSFVMLGLIYLLWRINDNEFFISIKFLFFLTIFSIFSFCAGLYIFNKYLKKFNDGTRRDGIVKWYSSGKGFGFIEHEHGEDIFVHQSEIRQSGFRYLNLGDHVEFEIGMGKKGPVALKVIRTKIVESVAISERVEEPEVYPITKVQENK